MTDHDSAFLWETEAIRSAAARAAEAATDPVPDTGTGIRWVTLREASQETGIPVETLRKWARRATIPTHLIPAAGGTQVRMVDLGGVQQRAADLGRAIDVRTETNIAAEQQASSVTATTVPPSPPPPGTMIVPVDAWNKMLSQLGNLHEAGQHLAEARERAAKAETEAKFLRERLAELREEGAADTALPASPQTSSATVNEPTDEPAPSTEKVWHYLIRRIRGTG